MLLSVLVFAGYSCLYAQTEIYYEQFDGGLGSWWIGFESGEAEGAYAIDTFGFLSGDNSLAIEIYSGGTAGWHVQALDKIQLEQDKTYSLSFIAATDADGAMTANVMFSKDGDPWTEYFKRAFSLEGLDGRFGPFTWKCNQPDLNYDLKWQLGGYDGVTVWLDSIVVTEAEETDVLKQDQITTPEAFSLSQNYPNPFNPSTTISYNLSKSGYVSLKIYDVSGHLVSVLADNFQTAGPHEFLWKAVNANDLPLA